MLIRLLSHSQDKAKSCHMRTMRGVCTDGPRGPEADRERYLEILTRTVFFSSNIALGLKETAQGRTEINSPVQKGSHREVKPIDTVLLAEPDISASASKGFLLSSFEPNSLPADTDNDSRDRTT